MERKLWHNTTIDEIIEEVTRISKAYGVRHLFLFGSYAKGTYTDTSDIDFIVQGIVNKDAYLEEINQIRTLKTIDIFDYDACENECIKEDMDKYGSKIY